MGARELVLLFILSSLGVTSSAGPCGDRESVVVQGGRRQDDGSLKAKDGTRFPPGCYWTSALNTTSGCPGKIKPCIWKCCPEGKSIDQKNKCNKSNNTLLKNYLSPPNGSFDSSNFDLIHGVPCLFESFEIEAETDFFIVYENGSLFVDIPDDDSQFFTAGDFCQEVLENDDGSAHIMYLGCNDPDQAKPETRVKFLINSIGIIISLPFLIATLVVYAVIPELRNLHGKCLMSHVTSLIVGFVCLALIQVGIDSLSTEGCIAAALIAYVSLLASFFWLNVMCFDIWWTFSGYSGRIGPKDPRDQLKFAYYSVYAWGAAVVFLCVCAAMQFAQNVPENYLRPQFGEFSCWFDDDPTRWAYFTGPVGVIIAFNVVFFALTALSIWKIKKQTAVLTEGKDSQRNAHTANSELRFNLYLKLFIVMGVSWTLEIISWAVGGPDYLWWLTDLANVLVGIPIFIIFVWKSKVKQLLKARLNIKIGSSVDTSGYELT